MDFFETHPIAFFIGIMFLWAWYNFYKIATRKEKADMAVAEIAGKEEWTTYQELTIAKQTGIQNTLQKIEIGLCIILVLMVLPFLKQFI